MHIDRPYRSRWPGIAAMLFHVLALGILFMILAIGEPAMRSATASVMQVIGIGGTRTNGIVVDSSGQIRYRSRSVTLEDLASVVKQELEASGDKSIAVQADDSADSGRIAQVLHAAGRAGARIVHLTTRDSE